MLCLKFRHFLANSSKILGAEEGFKTILILLGAFIAFGITYLVTPILIHKLKERKIVGIDVHKLTKPVCAEMGGLAVLLGFVGAFSVSLFLSHNPTFDLLPAFLTIIFVGVIGVFDDLFTLRQRYKPFLVGLASVPLMIYTQNYVGIHFPYFGYIYLGSFYLLLVPLAVATASNLTNMLAGFNGLEAGMAGISCFALGILCTLSGKMELASLAFILTAAYLAFLRYNWYPAKIFPGDTGTLMSGAAISCISILGHVEVAGIIMMIPPAIDFTLKMISRNPFSHRRVYGDTSVDVDGSLVPPPYPALPHAFMKATKLKERDLVLALLFMQIFYSILGIALTIFLM